MVADRWGGAGYRASASVALSRSTQSALGGEQVPPSPVLTPEGGAPQPPAMALGLPEREVLPGWWRAMLRGLSFGLYEGLEDEVVWRRRVDRARALAPLPDLVSTIVVAQPKGGVGKTPVSVLTACALARYARRSPAVWDLNENGGSRWRLGREGHTTADLLVEPAAGNVVAQVGSALVAQDGGAYQVLPAAMPPRALDRAELGLVHSKLEAAVTDIVVDTGNSVASANFAGVLGLADVVVVPTDLGAATTGTTMTLFAALEEQWGAAWGERCVLVETGVVPDPDREVRSWLEGQVAEVVRIPWDSHIGARGLLEWSALGEDTREACASLAAAVTDVCRRVAPSGREIRTQMPSV